MRKDACPFSILAEFDKWFEWHNLVYFRGKKPNEATETIDIRQRVEDMLNMDVLFGYGFWDRHRR